MNTDVVKTTLSLIKEKIIKTDTVLNIVCERNATIAALQSKLDVLSVKFIEKCKDLSVLGEQRNTKNKQIYSLTTRLVQLQEHYDQLAFDSNFAQTQSNEKYNEHFIIIQNLESELIKLNDLVNKLKAENALFKKQNGANANCEGNDGIFKATVKDFKGKIKILQNEVRENKRLHNLCQRDLQASREECERLDSIFNNYKNNFKRKAVQECLTCSQNASSKIEATLFLSNLDVQKEKYNKLYSQFEELQLSVNKLKNCNIEVAEKYSNLLLNQENQHSVKKFDVSSQTIETKKFNYKKEIEENRIDVDDKILRIRQLKSEKLQLKEDLAKAIKEKRIVQADFNYLTEDNNKIHDKYDGLLLEKEVLLMENKLKSNLVSIETQTCHLLQENSMYFEEIIDEDRFSRNNHEFDDLGLNLSSDSDSEKEASFCKDILEKMIRLPKIISPIPSLPKTFTWKGIAKLKNQLITPEIKITPASSIGNIDFLTGAAAQAIISDSSSLPYDMTFSNDSSDCYNHQNDANFDENLIKISTNNESTQTDFDLCKDISNLRKVDFGCQTFFDILTEERGIQCSKKYNKCKNGGIFLQKALLKIKINKCRYKYKFKGKNAAKGNLKSALEVFRKYAISMSFENGNLLNLESKNKLQINAINCFLFYKSNRLLKKFFKKFRDLKEALNIVNRIKLTAVILNGSICDKKLIGDDEIIDKEINEIVNNCHFKESRELNAILDSKGDLKGFGAEKANLKRKKVKNVILRGKVFNNRRKIRIQRLNDLRTKFEMKAKILDINEENVSLLEVKNTKLYYTSSSADSKDTNSVDFDSGYTDGSITSESSIKEIKEDNSIVKRVLRSSFKKKNSDVPLNANLMNKRRKILKNDLFGSDDSDDSGDKVVETLVVQKLPVKKPKVSTLEKMRQKIRNCNRTARNNTKILLESNVIIDENENCKKQLCLVAKERKKATKLVKSKKSFVEEMSNENEEKQCKDDLESREEINKLSCVNNINKEHLIQRFISDIPVKTAVEKTVFKKVLPRRKINLQDDSENDLLVSTKNILKNVDNNEVTSEESTAEEDDKCIKLLDRLIQYNCEESVISDVCDQLKQTSTKQISRLIIHQVYKFRSEGTQPSHTPLAPDLSPMYKTLIGFTNILSEKRQDIFTELLNQLEIRFLLQNNMNIIKKINLGGGDIQGVIPTYSVMSLEQVYRFYVSLCLLRTEVLRFRRFLCDMAFYQRDGWYALMYAVFTIWPAVLPKHFNEDKKAMLKENDALLMKVLMFFVFKKRNSDEYMHYRPFLTTFAFGYYKYTSDSLHMKTIFDELVEKFTTSDSNIIAYAIRILLQRITNTDLMELLRSESFNNVFKASDEEALIGKSKLLWLLDKIIPEIKTRGDAAIIRSLHSILEKLQTRVENEKVKNFIQSCIGKLTT